MFVADKNWYKFRYDQRRKKQTRLKSNKIFTEIGLPLSFKNDDFENREGQSTTAVRLGKK